MTPPSSPRAGEARIGMGEAALLIKGVRELQQTKGRLSKVTVEEVRDLVNLILEHATIAAASGRAGEAEGRVRRIVKALEAPLRSGHFTAAGDWHWWDDCYGPPSCGAGYTHVADVIRAALASPEPDEEARP